MHLTREWRLRWTTKPKCPRGLSLDYSKEALAGIRAGSWKKGTDSPFASSIVSLTTGKIFWSLMYSDAQLIIDDGAGCYCCSGAP